MPAYLLRNGQLAEDFEMHENRRMTGGAPQQQGSSFSFERVRNMCDSTWIDAQSFDLLVPLGHQWCNDQCR